MSLLAYSLITIIQKLSWIIYILIMIRVFLSWVPMNNSFSELIYNVTEPMLKPFKDVLNKYLNLPIDLSPLLFIVCVEAVEKILIRLIIVIFL
ncbi:YggT family protein [Fusobacterium animalis]|uniref:YggT family protein n=2 Tax=Fusobacterium animalis TaxID=76859 RepID=UPI0030D148A7